MIIKMINPSLTRITTISDSGVLIGRRTLILHHAETPIEIKLSLTSASLIFALLTTESIFLTHICLINKQKYSAWRRVSVGIQLSQKGIFLKIDHQKAYNHHSFHLFPSS